MSGYQRTFEILWRDCDLNGHARHTCYLDYAAHLRFAFMQERGVTREILNELQIGPILLTEEARYLREVMLHEKITVDYTCMAEAPDGSRWKLRHNFYNDEGKRAVRLNITGGWLHMVERKLVVPPPHLKEVFGNIPRDKNFYELPPLKI